jgi:hypothetical protein
MLYAIEDEVRGSPAEQRRAPREERSRVIVDDLKPCLEARLRQVSAKSKLVEALRYPPGSLKWFYPLPGRWPYRARHEHRRAINPTYRPKPQERDLCRVGRRRRNGAVIATPIENCKLPGINLHDWLTRSLVALANGHPVNRLAELMPRIAVPYEHRLFVICGVRSSIVIFPASLAARASHHVDRQRSV